MFLDLAKAFDTIDRNILFEKLYIYGTQNLSNSFFKSYFTGRQQYTNIELHDSTLRHVEKGIAQGSIIGPLMFLIYINDIVKSSSLLNFTLYADDTSVHLASSDVNSLICTVNQELHHVSQGIN